MALTGYFAGVWSDLMIQKGMSITLTRKIMQVWSFSVSSLLLLCLCVWGKGMYVGLTDYLFDFNYMSPLLHHPS